MRGGARPGAGRKRTKPLTLTEIGRRIEALGERAEVRGRFLIIYSAFTLRCNKNGAMIHLRVLEERAKT